MIHTWYIHSNTQIFVWEKKTNKAKPKKKKKINTHTKIISTGKYTYMIIVTYIKT